jgi:tRNA-dihydrouridine synthase B
VDLLRPLRIGTVTLPNNLVLSPMAGYTDLPFRALCRAHGAGLVCTEMVAAMSVEHEGSNTMRRMVTSPAERPVSIQVVGNEPEAVAHAAALAGERCEVLGLNMGCPAHQVAKTGCGAALLDQPELAMQLVATIKAASPAPLLVKMRAGTGRVMDCAAFAKRLEAAGADAILFHARTAKQSYSGLADWKLIREVKEAVSIPVVGNGDLRDGPGAAKALRETGCDGLAIGRGSLGDPRVFARIQAYLATGVEPPKATPHEKAADFRAYVEGMEGTGISRVQALWHAQAFSKGIVGGAVLRQKLHDAREPWAMVRVFEEHVQALGPERAAPPKASA